MPQVRSSGLAEWSVIDSDGPIRDNGRAPEPNSPVTATGDERELRHDHGTAAKTCSSQQKHWPNEIREFHPGSKFPRNAYGRERPRQELRECDSTRLGPVQTTTLAKPGPAGRTNRQKRGSLRARNWMFLSSLAVDLPLAGFRDDRDAREAGREIRQKPEIGTPPPAARANLRAMRLRAW